jgi:hypothetical protein
MVRLATWLCLAFPFLALLGWASTSHVLFEVIRVGSVGLLMLGMTLFFVAYLRTPQPPDGHEP